MVTLRSVGPLTSVFLVVSLVGAALILVDPPKDVKARVERPYVTYANPCLTEPLVTVDVAGASAVSKAPAGALFGRESEDGFLNPFLDPTQFRFQSVQDGEGTTFLVLHDVIKQNINVAAIDADGLPVTIQGQDRALPATFGTDLGDATPGSDVVLVPVSSGFFLLVQRNDSTVAMRVNLALLKSPRTAGGFNVPDFIPIGNVDLAQVRVGFAASLGTDLIVFTSEQVVRLSGTGGDSTATTTQLVGQPLFATDGRTAFAVVRQGNTSKVVKWSSSESWSKSGAVPQTVATLGPEVEVLAASAGMNATPGFLVNDRRRNLTSIVSIADDTVTSLPVSLPQGIRVTGVVPGRDTGLVMFSTSNPVGVGYVAATRTRQFTVTFDSPASRECVSAWSKILGDEGYSSVASRYSRPLVAGPYLYVSDAFGAHDCVFDTRRLPVEDTIMCTEDMAYSIDKRLGLTIDPLAQVAVLAQAIQRPSATTTTVPDPSATTTTIPNPAGIEQSPSRECETEKKPAFVSRPTVIGPPEQPGNSATAPYTRADNKSTITAFLTWSSSASECQPQEFVAYACVTTNASTCADRTREKSYVVGEVSLPQPFEIGGIPAKAGKKHLVWAVSRRKGTQSDESNKVLVDVPENGVCAPRDISAVLANNDGDWRVSWGQTDCDESEPSYYEMTIIDCTGGLVGGWHDFPIETAAPQEVVVKSDNDPRFMQNLRGRSVGFRVRSVYQQGDGELVRSSSVDTKKCGETTANAVKVVRLSSLGLDLSPVVGKRQMIISGRNTGGSPDIVAMYQTFGTADFDELCVSLGRAGDRPPTPLCRSRDGLRDQFTVVFPDLTCVNGKWNLLLSPRRNAAPLKQHEVDVQVSIDCDSQFSSSSAITPSSIEPLQSGNEQWKVIVSVADLGFDYIADPEHTTPTGRLRCDTWEKTDERFDGAVTNIDTNPTTGTATLTLTFDQLPTTRNPAKSCSLDISTPVSGKKTGSTSSASLSLDVLTTRISGKIAALVASQVKDSASAGSFERKVVEGTPSSFSHILTVPGPVCPSSVFTVTITAGNGPVTCTDTSAGLTWNISQNFDATEQTKVTSFSFLISVTVTSGTAETSATYGLPISDGSGAGVRCIRRVADMERDFCRDPRAALIRSVTARAENGQVNLSVDGDFSGLRGEPPNSPWAILRVCQREDGGECQYLAIDMTNGQVTPEGITSPSVYVTAGYCSALSDCASSFVEVSKAQRVDLPPVTSTTIPGGST